MPKGHAEKGQKCQKSFFRKKLLRGKNFVIFVKSKKITAEVIIALHMNKSCKGENYNPVQKCSDRCRDRGWTYALICFNL